MSMNASRIAAGYKASMDRISKSLSHEHGSFLPDGYVPIRRADANALLEIGEVQKIRDEEKAKQQDRIDGERKASDLFGVWAGPPFSPGRVVEAPQAPVEYVPGEPISEEATYILGTLLPEWTEKFLSKNKGYKRVESLGLRGYFVDLNRKIGKLKSAWWEGERLEHEGDREVALDMIGHLLLAIGWADNNIDGYRPAVPTYFEQIDDQMSKINPDAGKEQVKQDLEGMEQEAAWDAIPERVQNALRDLAYGHEVVSTPSLRQVVNEFIPDKAIF